MSDTPVNVFGRSSDAARIARLVADRLDRSTLQPEGTAFVVRAASKRGLLRGAGREVTVNVRLDYFEGDAGRRQTLGMANFIGSNLGGPGITDVLAMLSDLRVAISFTADPPIAERTDPLFQLALDVAATADGFVLSIGHGRVWSSEGGVLASTELTAQMAAEDYDDEDDFVPDPPGVDRVVRRLLTLSAVAARGLAEGEGEYLDEARRGILEWVDGLDLDSELESDERRLLAVPPGGVTPTDQVNGSWRTEGAAVLAWAVGLLDLPPHDQPIDPGDLSRALGFPDASATGQLVAALSLRPPHEINSLTARLFAVHWRLREYSLRPRAMDFAEFARTAWFGPLDIDDAALVDGDLAVAGEAVIDADPRAVATATSVVMERHLAANWLRDGGVYSETDTST